jgi:integral membrane protein
MLQTSVGRLRLVGLMEGISFLVLLGIAMPLKYLAGQPGAVSMVGMLHGLLFVLYIGAVIVAAADRGWSPGRIVGAVVAAIIPFGTFVLDVRLREELKVRSEKFKVES